MPRIAGGQVYGAARAVGLAHDAAITATAIAYGESTWNTDAHNGVGRDDSYGLWQINRKAHGDRFGTPAELTDIMVNARAMAALSAGGTRWGDWSVYNDGTYRQHLDRARKAADSVALKPDTDEGWEGVARSGAGVRQSVGLGGLVDLGAGLVRDPAKIPAAAGMVTGLGGLADLDPLAALGKLASALGDPAWWRRVGVGALGVALVVAGLAFLGRDLITDTARSIATGVSK